MCTFFCLAINHDQSSDGKLGPHFAELFLLVWLGFYVVGINFKLLAISTPKRSKTSILPPPSIFQLICVLGYSLTGPCISIIVLRVIEAIISTEMKYLLYEKLFIGLVLGFIWPTYSAVRILSKYQSKEKRILAIYPIALYYFIVSWFVISAHWNSILSVMDWFESNLVSKYTNENQKKLSFDVWKFFHPIPTELNTRFCDYRWISIERDQHWE